LHVVYHLYDSNNTNLTYLDLSRNLIGAMESRNAVQPDFNTGGEAIAELLEMPSCCLVRPLDHTAVVYEAGGQR
jgi:hypothetical protein